MLPAIVAEAPSLEQHVPRVLVRIVQSSASYKAHRQDSGAFTLFRLEHDGFPPITIGTVRSQERAEHMLDWWVANDRRVQRCLQLSALNQPTETIIDLVIEAARTCQD